MKKRIEHLLAGKFQNEQGQLLFSQDKITVYLKSGDTCRREMYFGAADERKIRGYVTSTDRRMVPGMEEFQGTAITLPYGVDTIGMQPGETRQGFLIFTTNIGEFSLPFEIITDSGEITSSLGEIHSLEDFCRLANADFREACRLFSDARFQEIILEESRRKNDQKLLALYQGFNMQPVTYQNVEEFLISAGLKEEVRISSAEDRKEFYSVTESVSDSVRISKNTWGHLRLEIETVGDFIKVEKKVLTSEDFIGSFYDLPFVVDKAFLRNGKHYGQIRVASPYETIAIDIIASRGQKKGVNVRLEEKKHSLVLWKDYLKWRCGKLDMSEWIVGSLFELNRMEESGFDYPEYRLYHAWLLHKEGKTEEAKELLTTFQDKVFTAKEIELAGAYLFLCTETGLFTDRQITAQKMLNFYHQKEDSDLLLILLLYSELEYLGSSKKTLMKLEEQFERGSRNPVLYIEAWDRICLEYGLLRKSSGFWTQVFLYAEKNGLLQEELCMRFCYLSGYEKTFSESLYKALCACYRAFPSDDALEAVCRYIILGNPRKKEYFPWFEKAVERGSRLTRLYEYYMETLDISYHRELPRPLLMYFAYNTNTLGDTRKAFLYANVISRKEQDPDTYERYRESIESFTRKKLKEGRCGEDYSILYQEFMEMPENEEEALSLGSQLFCSRLYCEDRKVRNIIVKHSQLCKEEVYPCMQGFAYIRLYTDDAAIFFQDEKQRRYGTTVDYNLKKLMDEKEHVEKILRMGVAEPGVLLYFCENAEVTRETIEIFLLLAKSPAFTEEYRNRTRKRILDYYRSNMNGEDLSRSLSGMDFREYARVDKKALLEILISRGRFENAFQVVSEFGTEGIEPRLLLRMVSRIIARKEGEQDDELVALAGEVYQDGVYDEEILKYLMKYRVGPMQELMNLLESARGFDLDTFDFEEKILSLLMLTQNYDREGEKILASYMRHSGKERIIGAYLTQLSYGSFVKENPVSPYIRGCLEYAYKNSWPVNIICHMALFKALAREKDPKGKNLSLKEELLAECMERGMIFEFYHWLPSSLLSPYQLDDKVFVECHALPEDKVTLFYRLEASEEETDDYRQKILTEVYEGIFVKTFTLFYGEKLRYFFQIESRGNIRNTTEKVISPVRSEGKPESKYQLLNQILSSRKLGRDQEANEKLKKYLRQEQFIEQMFTLRTN